MRMELFFQRTVQGSAHQPATIARFRFAPTSGKEEL